MLTSLEQVAKRTRVVQLAGEAAATVGRMENRVMEVLAIERALASKVQGLQARGLDASPEFTDVVVELLRARACVAETRVLAWHAVVAKRAADAEVRRHVSTGDCGASHPPACDVE